MKKCKEWTTIQRLFGINHLDEHSTVSKKLNEGLDVNTVDSGGRTLLMEAVVQQEHDLIKLLIDHGADPNIRDKRQWTALHFAAQNYDLRATQMLVEAGADVNAKDDYDNNVISRAVLNSKGKGDVIRFLKSHGADFNVKNKSGISALDVASRTSNYDLLPFLES